MTDCQLATHNSDTVPHLQLQLRSSNQIHSRTIHACDTGSEIITYLQLGKHLSIQFRFCYQNTTGNQFFVQLFPLHINLLTEEDTNCFNIFRSRDNQDFITQMQYRIRIYQLYFLSVIILHARNHKITVHQRTYIFYLFPIDSFITNFKRNRTHCEFLYMSQTTFSFRLFCLSIDT